MNQLHSPKINMSPPITDFQDYVSFLICFAKKLTHLDTFRSLRGHYDDTFETATFNLVSGLGGTVPRGNP